MARWLAVLTVLGCLAAARAPAATLDVELPPSAAPAPMPEGVAIEPVDFARAVVDMRAGQPWLDERAALCLPLGNQVSGWEVMNEDPTARLASIFSGVLTEAGFEVGDVGGRDLFATRRRSVDLQVGARISNVRARACYSDDGSYVAVKAVMDVEWQVFSVSQNRIMARISTRGGAKAADSRSRVLQNVIDRAFADSARNLAATEQFRTIVLAPVRPAPAAAPMEDIHAAMPALRPTSLDTAARSVVSVFAGDALGSGLVVSSEGYILTNHHVAGASGRVRLRWSDGSESIGEVLRGDARRDVALIKADPVAAPLSIRHTPVLLGETVFAIGTPLEEKFQGTVTRGIVSSNRVYEGLPFIQSDVVVNHGNSGGPLLDENGAVIGITVSGQAINGAPLGINLFVPIDDALRALALKPAGQTPR